MMTAPQEITAPVGDTVEPRRACYLCNYWYTKAKVLATDTPGACLCIGSPHEMPTADDVCDLWEAVD